MKDWVKAVLFIGVIVGTLFVFGVFKFSSPLSVEDSDSEDSVFGNEQAIATYRVVAREKYSNDAGVLEGALKVYKFDANPSDANANPLATIDVTNGKGSDTNVSLKTGTDYRVVWDGSRVGGTSYDVDYGVIDFTKGYNKDQAIYTFLTDDFTASADGIATYGTLSDICSEVATGSKACIGEQANVTDQSLELYGAGGADGGVTYNESAGDGSYVLFFTLQCSGSNVECKNNALDLLWDATNPPTGNEYTAITMQLDSGKDLGVPSDILNYFKNEQPVALGTLKGGDSSVYKITWSISEANADANMDYTILYDDLGGNNGKDVLLNTKGTKDTFTFSGTVAN